MLSLSIQKTGETVDLSGLSDPNTTEIPGIPHSEALLRFANASVGTDSEELSKAREMLVNEMGAEAMVDVAGVTSNFQRMVRIADSTGTPPNPLGEGLEDLTEDLREKLGLNDYVTAANKIGTLCKKLTLQI